MSLRFPDEGNIKSDGGKFFFTFVMKYLYGGVFKTWHFIYEKLNLLYFSFFPS